MCKACEDMKCSPDRDDNVVIPLKIERYSAAPARLGAAPAPKMTRAEAQRKLDEVIKAKARADGVGYDVALERIQHEQPELFAKAAKLAGY